MIKLNNLGEIVENYQAIRIDDLVRKVNSGLKAKLLQSEVETLGYQINLTTSKTRFGGNRFWFLCPLCNERRGVLYLRNSGVAYRVCLGLKYRKQRYKGMIESLSHNTCLLALGMIVFPY